MTSGINGTLLIVLWLTASIFLLGLLFSLRQNKFRLLNGVLANLLLLTLAVAVVLTTEYSQVTGLYTFVYYLLVVVTFPILIIYSLLGVLLLWNAAIVWKKESHSLGNTLTLILGIIIILLPMVEGIARDIFPKWSITLYQTLVTPVVLYIAFWFLAFVTSFLITRLYKPAYNKEYIIILGAGLYQGGQVTPLLASRIDRALDFAQKQLKKGGKYPVIICSGGQGADEKIPEGAAMKKYALAKGAPAAKVLSEEKSRNTYENLAFSKQLLQSLSIDLDEGLFSTSDYHTFRAAGYARYVGLNIDGLGAKTSRFFIPNAFLREYIALLMNHKYFHAASIVFLWCLALLNLFILHTNG